VPQCAANLSLLLQEIDLLARYLGAASAARAALSGNAE
jgi:hypothetical protein